MGSYSYTIQPLVSDRIRVPFFQGAPSLTISNQTVTDHATTVAFNLTLSQPALQPITVIVNTQDGTAVKNIDYTPIENELITFPAGTTTQTVIVPLLTTNTSQAFKSFQPHGEQHDDRFAAISALNDLVLDDSVTLSGPSVPNIATLVQTGSTVTATTTTINSLTTNNTVVIAGASVPAYDGTYQITVTSPTTFYVHDQRPPNLAAATGGQAAALQIGSGVASIVDQINSSNTFWSINDVTATDGTAPLGVTNFTFTISTNKSFATAQTVLVSTSGSSSDYVPLVNQPVTLAASATQYNRHRPGEQQFGPDR